MGGCCSRGLTKTEMAIVEARALQKDDHCMTEINLLLDDPFPMHIWEEVTALLRLPHNRNRLELLQVRPDEYWDASVKNQASLGDARIEILAAALCDCNTNDPLWRKAQKMIESEASGEQLNDEDVAGKELSKLKSLYLDFNDISPKGANSLATMLLIHGLRGSSLTMLSLNNNAIGNDGAIAIAHALKFNSTLQRLHLRDNSIGPAGSSALEKMMATNQSLIEIVLAGNQGEQSILKIEEALERNKTS